MQRTAFFIEFLIDSQLKPETTQSTKQYATKEEILSFREEMRSFEEDIKKLLKSFLDFFVGYGIELGSQPAKTELHELTAKLHELEGDMAAEGKKEAKIKWK